MIAATATATSISTGSPVPGRPQPWLAFGLTERTYYRRKAAGALDAVLSPEQHAAHALAWYATLDVFARLDHRAFVRRCQAEVAKAARPRQSGGDLLKVYAALRGLH